MGEPRQVDPVLLVVAVFTRHDAAFRWAHERLEASYGPIGMTSPVYSFHQTTYYQDSMGPDLRKQFLVFRALVPPDSLAPTKLHTNALEPEVVRGALYPELRPLNLDPGHLSLGKFLLATTKDQAHRIYLRDGIFAEVTLRYEAGAFVPWPWTYADYREPALLGFLSEARDFYRERLRAQRRTTEEAGS